MSTSALIPPAQVRKALRATELDNLVMTTTVEKVVAWASSNSIWPFGFGLACCAMEMIGTITSARYDVARFGSEVVRATPRQSDLIIVSGRVAHKMAEPIRQLYEQMLEPKWVMAMGACSSTAGMFANYAVLQGVDKIIPVDVYVPGCPPRPEAVMEGLITLQKKIRAGIPPAYETQDSDA
jgi:NADH-quinone oxidoreductase subunit B